MIEKRDDDRANDRTGPVSRRVFLGSVGATSLALAGCTGTDDEGDDGENGENGDSTPNDARWPAIDRGEVVDDFADPDAWYELQGEVSAAPDEAVIGDQAVRIENEDGGSAGIARAFPDDLDMGGQDLSMAVRMEAPAGGRISVEIMAPFGSDRLVSTRHIPADLDDWMRVDFGYTGERGEPDLTQVQEINILVRSPEGEPIRFWVDDLRTTPAADDGKAVLAFYGGLESHYTTAFEMLRERDLRGVMAVTTRSINRDGRVSIGQLREVRDAGWDVSSFPLSGTALPEMSAEEQRDAIERSQTYLDQRGFPDGARHFFAPYHRIDAETLEIVRNVHETGFVFGGNTNAAPPTGVHSASVVNGHDPADVEDLIDLAAAYGQLIVLNIPGVGDDMDIEDFEYLLDYLDASDLDVVTVSDLID